MYDYFNGYFSSKYIKKGEKKVRARFKGTSNDEKTEKNTILGIVNVIFLFTET